MHDAVSQLVYLTAVVPDAGESLTSIRGPEAPPWMDPGDDGTVGVRSDRIAELFLHDCDTGTIAEALERLTRQSVRPFSQSPRHIAWKMKPSTFVVCTEDHAILPERQRVAATRTSRTLEISTGHFPFLSSPETLADALVIAATS